MHNNGTEKFDDMMMMMIMKKNSLFFITHNTMGNQNYAPIVNILWTNINKRILD